MIESASVIIRRGRIYIPTNAKVEHGGPCIAVEPILVTEFHAPAMATALETIAAHGHPRVPSVSREEWKSRKDPFLQTIGVPSWKRLAKDSASYGIGWHKNGITIYLHSIDRHGRFSFDPKRVVILPRTATMIDIAQEIIRDVLQLPTLGFPDAGVRAL